MGLFNFLNKAMIDREIVRLGRREDTVGEDCPGIAYNDVIAYIKANDCTVIATSDDGWVHFERVVSGQRYRVQLDRIFTGGSGAFLYSKKI